MYFSLGNISRAFFEHSSKIAAVISIALIILMSLIVANSALKILEAANPPNISSDARQSNPLKEIKTYKVSNLELFGKTTVTRVAQEIRDAPKTKLNLELKGVFIADDKERSTAIVGEVNKKGELFNIGDRLPGKATLTAVFVDHILLRRGSRTEKLMFADNKHRIKKIKSNNLVERNSGANSKINPNLEDLRTKVRDEIAPKLATSSPLTSSDINAYSKKFKSDPASILNKAGIRPVDNGGAKGYKIGGDAQRQIRQAGLQPGDVVLSVNGRPVGAVANDSAMIDQVMASSRVRIEVQRGERRFFLTIPVPK